MVKKNVTKRRKAKKSSLSRVKNKHKKKCSIKEHHMNDGNGDLFDVKQKRCHQCKRKDNAIECKKCWTNRYCVTCITNWYPNASQKEFTKACPICLNNCNCKECLRGCSFNFLQAALGFSCPKSDILEYSQHIITKVFPLVRRLNEEQQKEKEIEAKVKGLSVSELQLQGDEYEMDVDVFCNKCGTYLFDFYRSCECGYGLCLECCRALRDGLLGKTKRIYNVIGSDDISHNSRKCCKCPDSYGYMRLPRAKDTKHFQLHWSKGEPVIVSDVLSTSSGLSWEPMVLWRAFRDINTKKGKNSRTCEVDAINCLDWSKVTINLNEFFKGYLGSPFYRKECSLILKLESWKPSCLSHGEWPRHFSEFVNCLPFEDYTHPQNGYLNVASKIPDVSSKLEMGPTMDIAYGVEEELEFGDSVTKLHFDKSDTVNVLTHTSSASTKLNKTEKVKQKQSDPVEGVALWDIFRRQDVPVLEKYLENHSAEFKHADCLSVEQTCHPIHDRTFYLNTEHKRKLKEKCGIEPWSFKQKLGDAVFIPAGCPYQVRNLKSNTKIQLNFLSPENIEECFLLQHKLRMLPNNHIAKEDKLNIWKMMCYALDHAVADYSKVVDLNGHIDVLPISKVTEKDDTANICNQTNGSLYYTESSVDDTEENITNSLTSEECQVKLATKSILSSDTHIGTSSSLDASLTFKTADHIVNNEPSAPEDANETAGFWRGNDVGLSAKELLQAVDHHYSRVVDLNGHIDIHPISKVTEKDDTADICNQTNGWLYYTESSEDDTEENITNSLTSDEHRVKLATKSILSSDTHIGTSSSLDASLTLKTTDHIVNEPSAPEDANETAGFWRGNDVGLAAKELLEAVDYHYPKTFQNVQVRSSPIWPSILKQFHVVIKGFLETSVEELTEDQVTILEEDLNEFERLRLDLSWAHSRLEMVKKRKFGNDPLGPLKETLVERQKLFDEALEMEQKAAIEYDDFKDAQNKNAL